MNLPGYGRRGARRWTLLLCILALWLLGAGTEPHYTVYFVAPDGDDAHGGLAPDQALGSINKALQLAHPGDRVRLLPGEYRQDVRSVRSGRRNARIRLIGPGAVVKGAGRSRVVELNHSHIMLQGLTIDGKVGDGSRPEHYRDKLLYVMGNASDHEVTGIVVANVAFRNAGGECLRMKYFAHHNEVLFSSFRGCGAWDFRFGQGGKNGEAVYIGTAPEQLHRNPTPRSDASDYNQIRHNYFDTQGNECVDIKEGARFNLVADNECTGQLDPNAAGLSARGNDNQFRYNLVYGNVGAGVRLGGDNAGDGVGNQVIGNILLRNQYGGLKVMRAPQGRVCGNTVRPRDGNSVRGPFAHAVEPSSSCLAAP